MRILAAMVVSLLPLAASASQLTELAAHAKAAVVHLEILDSTGEDIGNGTGFFISSDGLVATNHHVVADAQGMRAVLASGEQRKVLGVLADDEVKDVAIIQVEGSGYPALELGESERLTEGVPVVVIGSPMGLSWTLSEGIVSAARRELPREFAKNAPEELKRRFPLVQITAPISPGSSGSPVMGVDGKVIGVAQSIFEGAANVGFAVPVETLAKLRAGIQPGTRPRPLYQLPWRNLYISLGVFAVLGGAWFLRGRRSRQTARARNFRRG